MRPTIVMMALALVCVLPAEGNTLGGHQIEACKGMVDTDVGTTNNAPAFDVVNNVMTIENLSFDVTQEVEVVQYADTGPKATTPSTIAMPATTRATTAEPIHGRPCDHNYEQERQRLTVGRGTGGPGLIVDGRQA